MKKNLLFLACMILFVLNVKSQLSNPTVAAPTPTRPAADVISLFSNAYTDVPVNTWSAVWDNADFADTVVAGNDTKKYSNLIFSGIEFTTPTIDATEMTYYHIDVWATDASAIKVKLVDFGANGVYDGGGDDKNSIEYTLTPAPAIGTWVGFDIPLTSFTGLDTKAHLAQMLFVSTGTSVYVDNIYLYKTAVAPSGAPSTAAPTPTRPAADVISLFSNAYTDVPVNTWSAVWDNADFADTVVAGNDTKKYSNLIFSGIEFTTPTIDATEMTYYHIDVWATDASAIKVKLVDFGANGVYDGGGDDKNSIEYTLTPAPAIGTWVGFDIPLTSFTGLDTKAHLAQMLFVSTGTSVYVDNIYLYRNSGTTPITLVNFDAVKKSDGTVAINWATSNEFNSDYFLIERSIDGLRFDQVAKLAAQNNATGASYSISDRFPVNGINYYRLIQVDRDGNKKIYPVRKVNIINKNGSISVYPNPLTGSVININIPGITDSRLNVKLINLQGKIIYSGIAIQQGDAAQIRLNNKPSAGVYLLKVGEQKSIKIIVN